jgi:hypothetical protein
LAFPSGPATGTFTGTFDGCGYTIQNLYILTGTNYGTGLFGSVTGDAQIANVTVECNFSDTRDSCGGLAALVYDPTSDILIQNCHTSGTITTGNPNDDRAGGLISWTNGNSSYTINVYDCSSSVDLDTTSATTLNNDVGGLIGICGYTNIFNCFATGDVIASTASQRVGGLVGDFYGNTAGANIEYCYSTGQVTGHTANVGGLIGRYYGSGSTYVRKCYSTSDVNDNAGDSGGLIGSIASAGEITDCYAWGDVTTTNMANVGGIVGDVAAGTTFSQLYCIGAVTGTGGGGAQIGGFSGSPGGTYNDTYWDTDTSGWATSQCSSVGHTTNWLQTKSNYPSTWNFVTIWYMPGYYDLHRTTALGAYAASNAGSGADDGLYLGAYAGSRNTSDPNVFFLDELDRGSYANEKTKSMMYGTFAVDPNDQQLTINVGELNLPYARVDVNDVNVAGELKLETFSEGSVLFADSDGVVSEDNTNFKFTDSNDVLQVASTKNTDLTESRLVSTDADKVLASTDAASWIDGTANQVVRTDDGDGTVTLATPQDIHTGASPTFAGMTITNAITEFSTDGTMAGNSDSAVPTEKAVVTYVAASEFGPLNLTELSADPDKPAEGKAKIWMSDGTGTGDDGDVIIAATAGGVTKREILWDFSAATEWFDAMLFEDGDTMLYEDADTMGYE